MAPDDEDKKVKELIDVATRAELEKWFSLPSFGQLEDNARQAPTSSEDPEVVAVRERREKAIAAVDPALVEAHRRRVEAPDSLIRFAQVIDLKVDPDLALIDLDMFDARIAEPREVQIPDELEEDLKECTPQAILRDLHRPELDFDKTFEVVDMAAEQRFDVVAAVAEAMATSWKLVTEDLRSFREGRQLLVELRAQRRVSITDFLQTLPNRRVTG